MEIVGYTRPVVAHCGEMVECMVSTTKDGYRYRLVHLTRGEGEIPVESLEGWRELPGRAQEYPRGSYMEAELPSWPSWRGEGTIQCWFCPTLLVERQCLMSVFDGDRAWDLEVEGDKLYFRQVVGGASQPIALTSPLRIQPGRWYFAAACVDLPNQRCGVAVALAPPARQLSRRLQIVWSDAALGWAAPTLAMVAASAGEAKPTRHFNGKIDSPRLFTRCLPEAEVGALASGSRPALD